MTFRLVCPLLVVFFGVTLGWGQQATTESDTKVGDDLVTEYFRLETRKLAERTFADIDSLDDWQTRRQQYRQQLFEMLGLAPLPQRTPLQAQVTGQVQQDDFIVENLTFQSRPGLYVTANLYRPADAPEPLPAILYVCGHGRVKKDGISYGNKTHYQHHGAWFARHGYVCLTIDTIQLGEIEGIHHGTYREKMWWWNNRGYTPAGVEAWNCIRALDYLQTRKEVDAQRIGVTGRSGGGAYSWWIAALDDRIKAAVPVAGITSLHNHVVDGCVEGHCDCMFTVNTYRWDYPMIAALVAPRPLLISNTDKDRIFPLDGVVDVHSKVRKIYQLYDAEDKLGLHITEGPHSDTQELRIHAFRWLNRFLKDDETLIEKPAIKFFEPQQLKVFDRLPEDERVTEIHESFVPAVSRVVMPQSARQFEEHCQQQMTALNEKTFRGWPDDSQLEALDVKVVAAVERDGIVVQKIVYTSQTPYRLTMYRAGPATVASGGPNSVRVRVLDQPGWMKLAATLAGVFPQEFSGIQADADRWQALVQTIRETPGQNLVFLAPRGVGPTLWSQQEKKRTQIRRRFMLLGQTAASMQIWDVRRALQALREIDSLQNAKQVLEARQDAAVWALYASLYEPGISQLNLHDLPGTNRQAPDLLNVSRSMELTHVVAMAARRALVRLQLEAGDPDIWQPLARLNWDDPETEPQIEIEAQLSSR
ncbi:MAG: acetylxylan esterase [Pirellulales bacterium]|nr:acetylxylan esterase [Pirellulales bacterium]